MDDAAARCGRVGCRHGRHARGTKPARSARANCVWGSTRVGHAARAGELTTGAVDTDTREPRGARCERADRRAVDTRKARDRPVDASRLRVGSTSRSGGLTVPSALRGRVGGEVTRLHGGSTRPTSTAAARNTSTPARMDSRPNEPAPAETRRLPRERVDWSEGRDGAGQRSVAVGGFQ